MDQIDAKTMIELEAAAFRTLRAHLMEKRTDVQSPDSDRSERRTTRRLQNGLCRKRRRDGQIIVSFHATIMRDLSDCRA